MIPWMLQSIVAAALVACAALAAEEAMRLLRRPRRWAWLAAMVCAAILPVGAVLLPPAVAVPAAGWAVDPALLDELARLGSTGVPDRFSLSRALASPAAASGALWAWATGTLLLLCLLAVTHHRLRRIARGPLVQLEGIPARITTGAGPMVVGLRRPVMVMPRWVESLPEDERRLIVRHEWEHARAGDTRLLAASALLVALLPWNLPLWWMQRRLRQAVEVDCDARVLASGADVRSYGSMLIRTAGRPAAFPLLAPALVRLPSLLERRIVAMTTGTPRRPALRLVPLTAAGALLVVAACELTPRASSLSPTEPTLANILEPADSTADERVVIRLDAEDGDSAASGPVRIRVRGTREGEVSIARVGPNGDTTWLPSQRIRLNPLETGNAKPLYFVDGRQVESTEGLDPERIATVEVIKGPAAVEQFGARATDGVIQITTKESGAAGGGVVIRQSAPGAQPEIHGSRELIEPLLRVWAPRGGSGSGSARAVIVGADGKTANPLILVDGKRVASMEEVEGSAIASIEVLKGQPAVERYGEEAKDGVVLIKLK